MIRFCHWISGDRQVHFKPNSDPDPTGFVLVQGKNNFVQWGASSAVDVEEINLNKTTDLGTCDANDAETKEVCPFLKPALHQRELYHRAHAKKYGGMVYGDDYFTSQLDFWYPAVFYEGIVVLISTKSKGYGVVVDQKTDECYYLVDYKSFDEEKNIPGHDVEAAQKALNSLNPAHKAVRIPIFESAEQVASFREGLKDTIDYTIFRSRGFEQSGTLFLHLLAFATTCFLGGLVMCCGLAFKTGGAYDTINSKPVDIQEIARENFYAEISSSDDGEKSVGKKGKKN
uniref:DOMON domain-containing protein n=1 Tax=Bursaphelenchus xylophilus TaxID=6326 RepID=A0A1I7S887_BURXY